MTRTISLAGAAFAALAAFAAPTFATDPLPGVEINLGQNPGGIAASGGTNAEGKVSFPNLAPGAEAATRPQN